ncbi:hypothetical protein HQ487_03275 [Candidatus Uhrbacteria bacterium]|nr:hypothetical protein [Candidatus Uhrbacteria bacterium]
MRTMIQSGSVQIFDLDQRSRVRPISAMEFGRDHLLVELENDQWVVCVRWAIMLDPTYTVVRKEFSRGIRGNSTTAQAWMLRELDNFDFRRAASRSNARTSAA